MVIVGYRALEHTTFPSPDGTTCMIVGDIPLTWHHDSCAQVNQHSPLLAFLLRCSLKV